ncbi:MAG: transcription elongation factor GreA [Solirubrobacteraceae bacterium]|jgi:transcription elongation factor GreA
MDDATLMTAADLEALQAELAQLEGEGRRDIASRIKTAREWGDLKENSEYHDAKNEQAHLETRIAMLRDRLARAQVVEVAEDGPANGVVAFGSVVIVRDEQGSEQRFELVSSRSASPGAGQISIESPVAKALLGRRAGERASVSLPRGTRELIVVSVA